MNTKQIVDFLKKYDTVADYMSEEEMVEYFKNNYNEEDIKTESNMELRHYLDKVIYEWVKENFGTSEAYDPSWSIVELANEIAEHKTELHDFIEREYQAEDCKAVAEEMGVNLTDSQVQAIVDNFMYSETYADRHTEDWKYFINEELKK